LTLRSPPLFWRTFLLILMLIAASLAAWLPSVQVFERDPRARQIAQQVVSIVNTTRSALIFSDPGRRRELLSDLADNEGIRVVPLEPGDLVVSLPDDALVSRVTRNVRAKLGAATRLAAEVNGVQGIWVSFTIDDDAYWAYIDRDILAGNIGREWVAWAALAAILSTLIAAGVARIVNRPLAALTRAATDLGAGRRPAPLPEAGPAEIMTVNRSFNRMVADLDQLERDRVILLAGISHDLRTPLTRLRLELELNALPEPVREAMIGDLDQMDSIVRQFLDYARPAPSRPTEPVNLSALALEAIARNRLVSQPGSRLQQQIAPNVRLLGHPIELSRALDNLILNAVRYGRGPDGELALRICVRRDGQDVVVEICDEGPGIATGEMQRLLRPFERGDAARTGTGGAGLGLAIVDRIARIHRGRLLLQSRAAGGLCAQLRLPAAEPDLLVG
jgi:two-component system, OmpR family, osmolarity sensor histidine kinase EnvZ